MLNKKYRFHSRGGVKYTYQKGTTKRGSKISLTTAKNTRHKMRFAVVISKKVIKSAVGRNRVRRRVYEAIRLNFDKFPKETDYIFNIYSADVLKMDFSELQNLILGLVE